MDGFISYANVDFKVCETLRVHLRPLERKFKLALWHDDRLKAGHHWNEEIAEAIVRAQVFIMLVSPGFLASDYIWSTELPAIKRRLKACKGKAISVLVQDCDWEFAVGSVQAVPSRDRRTLPIEGWRPRNKGYDTARAQIDDAIGDHFGLRPRRPSWPRT